MRKLISVLCLWAALMLPAQAAFAATLDDARSFVDHVGSQALVFIGDKSASKEAKQKKLEGLFAGSVDIPWVGKFVLGRFWRQATPEQRERYLKEYSSFLTLHYAGRFADYSGGSYKLTDANADEEGNFTVTMKIISQEGQEVLVDYRLHETDAKQLRIYDVIVEGVSLIATQRSEFASVLGNKGLDYLIEQLANRTIAPPVVAKGEK